MNIEKQFNKMVSGLDQKELESLLEILREERDAERALSALRISIRERILWNKVMFDEQSREWG